MSKLNWNVQAPKMTQTENGALAFASTGHALTNFFASFGAMRLSSESQIIEAFIEASAFNLKDAVKLLFFFRDCRGGQGEKRVFEVVYRYFIDANHPLAFQMLEYVPEYGYWKDVAKLAEYAYTNRNEQFFIFASELYANQLLKDMTSENMSLAAKYAPDQNYKNKNFFNAYFNVARKVLNVDRKGYRQLLSAMRKALNVVEVKMSANRWDRINFESVPSVAHKNYRKAFGKHQQERYSAYLESVKSGDKKINAKVLTPVEIMHKYLNTYDIDTTLEEQWKALPNYVNDDVLAVCDVSGSMNGRPMEISVALGIYLAQRATGVCKNELVTFSGNPSFFDISGCKNLRQAIDAVQGMEWGMNTDLIKTFELLLKAAKDNNATDKEMPKYILIISDMQYDKCTTANRTPFEEIKRKFTTQELTMPKIVFWQVNSRNNNKTFPCPDENGTIQISGESPAVLQYVLGVLNNNSMQVIEDILSNPRYAFVGTLSYFS